MQMLLTATISAHFLDLGIERVYTDDSTDSRFFLDSC